MLFGAYNEENVKQKKWVEYIQATFCDSSKYYTFFKPITLKGGKNKGNVDTEMWFELSEMKNEYDTAILFSWDWDFAYIIDRLISENWKKFRVISTAQHTGKELFGLSWKYADPDCFRLYDINSNDTTIAPLKQVVRWQLFLMPELIDYLKQCSKNDIQKSIDCIDALIKGTYKLASYQNWLMKLQDHNGHYVFSLIKKWKREDKMRFLHYLHTLT